MRISTRFGLLETNDENIVLYNGHPLDPELQGNNSISLIDTFQIGNNDVALLQNNGGTACPALYYFVTLSASGVHVTPQFGTCSDLIKVQQRDGSIIVAMPGYMGPFESEENRANAAIQEHTFIYENGSLTENGKLVNR